MGASRAQWPSATGICRLIADGGSDSLADRQIPIVALQPEFDNIDVRRESISSLVCGELSYLFHDVFEVIMSAFPSAINLNRLPLLSDRSQRRDFQVVVEDRRTVHTRLLAEQELRDHFEGEWQLQTWGTSVTRCPRAARSLHH